MNRLLLLPILLMLCLPVSAGTLSDTQCGTNPVQCHSVGNSDGPAIDLLQYDYLRGHVVATIGMSRYEGYVKANSLSWTNLVLTDQNGFQVLLTATFKITTPPYSRIRTAHWELVSGTLQ